MFCAVVLVLCMSVSVVSLITSKCKVIEDMYSSVVLILIQILVLSSINNGLSKHLHES